MASETSEERRNKILKDLPYDILMNPDMSFESIAENLVQKGIITDFDSDRIVRGWRMGHGIYVDKTLESLRKMPGLQHLKGPMTEIPNSQSSYLKNDKPDYRTMLDYYVNNFENVDYEKIGNEYVTQKRLPQIAVDNILHDWRKKRSKTIKVKSWREEGEYFQGLLLLILLSFFPAIILFNLDFSNTVKLLLFCIPFGYAVQYNIIKKQMLKYRADKFYTILHSRVQKDPNPPDYDEGDEITAKYFKLREWGLDFQYEAQSDLSKRIIVIYLLYFLIILIWSFL